jgi:predicted NBD/HSP70 family sugar kinase
MYLAVDIGATKVLLAVFTKAGELVEQYKFPTGNTYESLIADLSASLQNLRNSKFDHAVIAVPGRLDRENGIGIAFGNRPWQNVPIGPDIAKIVGCNVTIENDAKLAALSEALLIKNDFKKVLYVTISTGISAGLIVDGVIDPELADSESGQMWFEHNGKPTQWEDFASGRAIVKKYGKRASEITDTKIWETIAHNIAQGLIELIVIIQPEVIILGGGVGTHFDKYKTPLMARLKTMELPITPIPPIKKAVHPEEAVVYGCYDLAKQVI